MKRIMIGEKKEEYYNGILIRADLGLHEDICNLVENHVQRGGKVLDWGAGQGALTQRLLDRNYNVTAVDIDPADFKSDKARFVQIDFNDSIAVEKFINLNSNVFDLVMGIEVIEHIKNPWEYVNALKQMVRPGGYIVISTPNISSWLSRLEFLYRGRFICFSDEDVSESGHITPILPETMKLIAKRLGLVDVNIVPGGSLPTIWLRKDLKSLLMNFFALLMRPIQRGQLEGWCNILICRRPEM